MIQICVNNDVLIIKNNIAYCIYCIILIQICVNYDVLIIKNKHLTIWLLNTFNKIKSGA